jgi:hypothetical protein
MEVNERHLGFDTHTDQTITPFFGDRPTEAVRFVKATPDAQTVAG